MTTLLRHISIGLALAVSAGSAGAADGGIERTLLDRELRRQSVELLTLDAERLTFRDRTGRVRSMDRAELVAILPSDQETVAPIDERVVSIRRVDTETTIVDVPIASGGLLCLTDGQQLLGRVGDAMTAKPDALAWNSELIGAVTVPLDRVRRVIFDLAAADGAMRAAGPVPRAGNNDRVLLLNGDRLSGFIDAVQPVVKIEATGQKLEFEHARIAEIVLASPAVAPKQTTVWLETTRGVWTVLACSAVKSGRPGQLELASVETGATVSVPLASLRALVAGGREIVSLASIAPSSQKPGAGRRWAPPVRVDNTSETIFGGATVALRGPMTVEWALPARAARMVMTLELPTAARVWGDCGVSVQRVDKSGKVTTIAQGTLNAETPSIDVRTELDPSNPGTLRVSVTEGARGPIQDDVVLREALIVLQ
jgi:hypothetical protein